GRLGEGVQLPKVEADAGRRTGLRLRLGGYARDERLRGRPAAFAILVSRREDQLQLVAQVFDDIHARIDRQHVARRCRAEVVDVLRPDADDDVLARLGRLPRDRSLEETSVRGDLTVAATRL